MRGINRNNNNTSTDNSDSNYGNNNNELQSFPPPFFYLLYYKFVLFQGDCLGRWHSTDGEVIDGILSRTLDDFVQIHHVNRWIIKNQTSVCEEPAFRFSLPLAKLHRALEKCLGNRQNQNDYIRHVSGSTYYCISRVRKFRARLTYIGRSLMIRLSGINWSWRDWKWKILHLMKLRRSVTDLHGREHLVTESLAGSVITRTFDSNRSSGIRVSVGGNRLWLSAGGSS